MKIIKKKILIALPLAIVFVFVVSLNFAGAIVEPEVENVSDLSVPQILENIASWGAGIVSLVAALVIIIAGILWATAGGDEDQQTRARKLLISGIVGLVIALAAVALVKVVTGLL